MEYLKKLLYLQIQGGQNQIQAESRTDFEIWLSSLPPELQSELKIAIDDNGNIQKPVLSTRFARTQIFQRSEFHYLFLTPSCLKNLRPWIQIAMDTWTLPRSKWLFLHLSIIEREFATLLYCCSFSLRVCFCFLVVWLDWCTLLSIYKR